MSISSEVIIGYYIKAKLGQPVSQVEKKMACSNEPDHHLPSPLPKFCPECGGKVKNIDTISKIQRSLVAIQWEGEDYDWIKAIQSDDCDWINENFSVHDTNYINGEEGYDYVVCGGWRSIDGLENAVIPMSVVDLTTHPTIEDIKRLQAIMQYETVELLFGALVAVSS